MTIGGLFRRRRRHPLQVRYEGQRDMLYNQTFNLDQVAFATEGIKDAQQTMSALKSANKEMKGMMKTVNIQDIDGEDEMGLPAVPQASLRG
ncbi:hypothetical protein QJS10_CPA10g01961 [Acorus calamus]|uniref:Uncharacterized protein n=1 Tax=Acorus calamus TaxID=4465 RepID=A0AAV9DXF1_ACOCL|nr:hypothetical protein QJS10_CPA10g01961 [Acorus calamus]